MNYNHIKVGMLLLCSPMVFGFGSKTFFAPRSQSVDFMSEYAGARRLIHRPDYDENYIHLSMTALYAQAFDSSAIARYFFGSPSLTFSGSRYPERGQNDILADYFGLSTTAKSVVCFDPEIANFTNDFYWYLGFDKSIPGLYMSVRMPLVHTLWDLKLHERIIEQGDGDVAGYMGPTRVEIAGTPNASETLASGVKEFLSGVRHTSIGQIVPLTFGDMNEPLKYGKIVGRQTATQISELVVTFGYMYEQKKGAIGANVRAAFNTGNKSRAEYLFEAIIGNGGHWELGLGLQGYLDAWSSQDGFRALSFYLDAMISHLFSSKQCRSFDFKRQGNGSRYMLLEQFGQPSHDLFLGAPDGAASLYQYAGRIIPAINATTLSLKTDIPVQAEVCLSALYEWGTASIEVGYSFFARAGERGRDRDKFPSGVYGIKGDAQLYGFDSTTTPADNPVALAATQYNATIHAGQGTTNFVAGVEFANKNCDDPILAADSAIVLNNITAADFTATGIPIVAVSTSSPSKLLNDSDINCNSALLPSAMSNRLCAYISKYWDCDNEVAPFIGFGGYAEWAQSKECQKGLPSQWSVAFKGGVSF